jgi:lipoate-protein ligase A
MDELATQEWRLIRERGRPGPMQMALDEVAAETAARGGPRTVRVYRWSSGTLSLGYHQETDTVDWDHCADAGIDVTRRRTGGGGIYHDIVGDISYSVAVPTAAVPRELTESYQLLLQPILRAFEWLDVPAALATHKQPALHEPSCYLQALNPAHDVVVSSSATDDVPRKISGNAQYREADVVLQHGSITFSLRPERHLSVFADPDVSVETFRERVTAIDRHTAATRNAAVRAVERSLRQWVDAYEGSWSERELERARELAENKYGSDEWIRNRTGSR